MCVHALHLGAMAAAWTAQRENPQMNEVDFDGRFGMLVDAEHLALDPGVHDADPRVHDADPGVHDAPILAFTMPRSAPYTIGRNPRPPNSQPARRSIADGQRVIRLPGNNRSPRRCRRDRRGRLARPGREGTARDVLEGVTCLAPPRGCG
jgi:hypothetical protein